MSTELDSGGLSEPATADSAPTAEIAAVAQTSANAPTEVIAVVTETETGATAPGPTAPGASAPGTSAEAEPAAPARRRAAHRARRKTGRSTRITYALAAALVTVGLAAGISLPSVQTVLKQSFTRIPQPYAALYFTSDPTLDGAALTVPISVQPTDEGVRSYNVRVWTATAAGTVNGNATTATVAPKNGVWTTVVTLTIAPTAAVVWVALDGTQQTLHFRINGA